MRNGFVLVTVLVILLMVALGSAAILKSLGTQADLKSNNVMDVQNKYLADAAMVRTAWVCRSSGACPNGNTNVTVVTPAGNQSIPVNVSPSGSRSQIHIERTFDNVQT